MIVFLVANCGKTHHRCLLLVLLFDFLLDFQRFKVDNYKKIYCILLSNEERQVKLGYKVLEYKKNLIKNQIQNSGLNIEFIKGNKFIEL